MQKKKLEKELKETKTVLDYYSKFKGKTPMAHFSGNFYGGGFYLSKNKIIAVIDNIEELKSFVSGKYDKNIEELEEDEVLTI